MSSEMEKLYSRQHGGIALVVGNGPSLKDVPNTFLDKYPTFGSNRIYLKYQPTYYAAVNPLVISQFWSDIARLGSVKFVTNVAEDPASNLYSLHSSQLQMFSFNPAQWIYEGYTVTFVLLQLAFFMGFSTVLLVGVDHRYQFDGSPNESNVLRGSDPNHFSPEYFMNSQWNNPDLEQSEKSYNLAKVAYESNGRRIINLTSNSALEVFEKGYIREW